VAGFAGGSVAVALDSRTASPCSLIADVGNGGRPRGVAVRSASVDCRHENGRLVPRSRDGRLPGVSSSPPRRQNLVERNLLDRKSSLAQVRPKVKDGIFNDQRRL
jgi:hypothetical protein